MNFRQEFEKAFEEYRHTGGGDRAFYLEVKFAYEAGAKWMAEYITKYAPPLERDMVDRRYIDSFRLELE